MGFWIDSLAHKCKIPYPVFFGLIPLLLFLLGIPVMIVTDNLAAFLTEPRWLILAVYGAFSAIFVVFMYRKFFNALEKVRHLVRSDEEFQRMKHRTLSRLTHWAYWIIVLFWTVLNLLVFANPASSSLTWYGSYNQIYLVAVYYQIAMVPANVFGGMFMYVIPIGLTLAYRNICVTTAYNHDQLRSEWMSPFGGFRSLITLALLVAGISAILVLLLWAFGASVFAYASIVIIVVPTLIFPHYYFHVFFSGVRTTELNRLRRDLLNVPNDQDQEVSRRMLLLLEEARIERKKTWLIDIVTTVEILIVALMHVLLVEFLTVVFHI